MHTHDTISEPFFQFLSVLHSGGKWGYYWTAPDKISQWWPAGQPGELPNGNSNIYFGVHPARRKGTAKTRSRNTTIAAVNCLFAEFDAKDLGGDKTEALNHVTKLSPSPSAIIDSGGGFHAYWLLEKPFILANDQDRTRARELQAAWVAFVGGDPGAKDLARVLRVPGTLNYKYDPPRPVAVFSQWVDLDLRHDLDYLAKISQPEKPKQEQPAAVATVPQAVKDDRPHDWGEYFLKQAKLRASVGNRNKTGFWLACQLRDNGYTQGEADQVLRSYATLAPGDGYTQGEAEDSVKSAYTQPAREPTTSRISIDIPTGKNIDLNAAPEDNPAVEKLLNESRDHNGHAVCVIALYPDKFAYCDKFGWLFFNGRHWQQEGGEGRGDRAIVATLKARRLIAIKAGEGYEKLVKATSATSTNLNGTKTLLRSLIETLTEDYDNHPDLLNCKNGVLDLRSGEMKPHSKDYKFTYSLPVDYNPKANPSPWVNFLHQVCGAEMTDFLQMAVGYSLTGHTWEEILFYIFGPTRSGKGTFTETILKMFGHDPIATEADFETFTANRDGNTQNFDLAGLKPCRFVAASESNKHNALNPAKIKQMTGGNSIRCAFKHRSHFTYRPQFKIWLSSNHPVNVDVDDLAAWARLRVINFPHSFLGKEDKTLKRRLGEPQVLTGVLRWAVEGAKRWYANNNGLPLPQAVADATEAQRTAQDFVQQFLDEMCAAGDGIVTPSGQLHRVYKEWANDNGITPKHQRLFSQSLEGKGFELARRYINGTRKRCVVGLGVKTE